MEKKFGFNTIKVRLDRRDKDVVLVVFLVLVVLLVLIIELILVVVHDIHLLDWNARIVCLL